MVRTTIAVYHCAVYLFLSSCAVAYFHTLTPLKAKFQAAEEAYKVQGCSHLSHEKYHGGLVIKGLYYLV